MSRIKILVVDDDADSCQLLVDVLEQEGYQVDRAGDGARALDLLAKNSYQVAFLDIRLPDMSGLDILARIKQEKMTTEAVMHTAYASIETSIKALNKGALTYIIKPFYPQEARLAVKRALDKQRLERENIRLIEDLKKRNSELEKAYRQLEELSCQLVVSEKTAALTTLAGGIAHELNNPLTSILGMLRLLLDEETEGSDRFQRLTEIQKEVKRCAEIVRDLLTFSRQVSGDWEGVDCNRLLDRTLRVLHYQIQNSGVEIETALKEDLPPVKVIPARLGQAFLSLIINALEAASGGGGKIVIGTSFIDNKVTIEFRDNGRGISEEMIPRIFEPFFTTKETGKGPGLGLAVCDGIVKSFGGSIEVESKAGKGTTFRIALPALSGPAS